jgi:amino acid transporter
MFAIQFGMGQSIVLSCSRQMWAFSRDNALPMSRWLKRVTKRPSPYMQFGVLFFVPAFWVRVPEAGLTLGLLALVNTATAQTVFAITVLGTYAAYGTPIFCRLVWGGNTFKPKPFYLGRFSKPVAWGAIVYMTFMVIFLSFV